MGMNPSQRALAVAYHLAQIIHTHDYQLQDVNLKLRMAEIGVKEAHTSRFLLELFPKLHMALVDIDVCDELLAVTEEFEDRTRFFHTNSLAAAKRTPNNSLHLIFIDAVHTYSSVRDDIRAWAPKLRQGGFMGGHDLYDAQFPGVRKAIKETGLSYVAGPGHTWWFRQGNI